MPKQCRHTDTAGLRSSWDARQPPPSRRFRRRDFTIGAARVKADAAAIRVAANFTRLLMRLREMCFIAEHDLKRPLIHVLHKTGIKGALAGLRVFRLHLRSQRIIAAKIHAPAADGPEQHFDHTLGIAIVCLGKFRAAQLGLIDRHKAVLALDSDFEGLVCALEIGFCPYAEGNEVLVQHRLIFDGISNLQIFHTGLLTYGVLQPQLRHR